MTDKSNDKVGHLNTFGLRGREFKRSNLQKFKCPGESPGVGGGGGGDVEVLS